jgi:epoxyqueuosine reductase QueG
MMNKITQTVIDKVMGEGACDAGIATTETLEGGPPSVDLSYVLPEAKSAVCFVLALDQSLIIPYLKKEDYLSHTRDNTRTNKVASGIALDLARFLEQKGFPSYPVASNVVYRQDTERGLLDLFPDISLRYLAVASGIAQFGLSGNVIREEEGAAIILGAVVTTAELEPTAPLPWEDRYCDGCRLCVASCASGLMDPKEEDTVTLGGMEYTYAKRLNYNRCGYVCGGFTGLHSSGKWSTWSPGRFPIPENDNEFVIAIAKSLMPYHARPELVGARVHLMIDGKFSMTCGNCQLVCAPDREERERRYGALIEGGCVVQNPDGSVEAFPPQEAAEHVAAMNTEIRKLYEEI